MQQTCSRCGGLLAPGTTVCNYCGTPVASAYAQQNYPPPQTQYGAYPQGGAASSDPYAAQYGTQAAPPPPPPTVPSGLYGQSAYGGSQPPYGASQSPYGGAPPATAFGAPVQPPPISLPPQPGPFTPSQPPAGQKKSPATMIGIILAVVIVLAGLGVGGYLISKSGSNQQANATPTATVIPPLYQASLTSDPGSWVCNSSCSFRTDGYHIQTPDNSVYASYTTNPVLSDMVIQVSAILAKGSQDSEMDVVFRIQQNDTLAGYLFRIFPDGTYQVSRSAPSTGSFTTLLDRIPSTALHSGLNQSNKLKILVKGSQLTFFINDKQVNQVNDTKYTKGYIGLAAGGKNAEAIFSNLLVTKP